MALERQHFVSRDEEPVVPSEPYLRIFRPRNRQTYSAYGRSLRWIHNSKRNNIIKMSFKINRWWCKCWLYFVLFCYCVSLYMNIHTYSEIILTVIYHSLFPASLGGDGCWAYTCCMIATVTNWNCRLSVWNYTRTHVHLFST